MCPLPRCAKSPPLLDSPTVGRVGSRFLEVVDFATISLGSTSFLEGAFEEEETVVISPASSVFPRISKGFYALSDVHRSSRRLPLRQLAATVSEIATCLRSSMMPYKLLALY